MGRFEANVYDRRSIRLKGYDYSFTGMYFVTLCVKEKCCLFGRVDGEVVNLFSIGKIVKRCWEEIPGHFGGVGLDEFIIMPNHVHGIIIVGATHASPLRNSIKSGPKPRSLGSIVGSFKSAVTRRVNRMQASPGSTFWQRNYWEHVIRDEKELNLIRQYILDNPLKWKMDRENPKATIGSRRDEIEDILVNT